MRSTQFVVFDDWESFALRAERKSENIQLSKLGIMTHNTSYSDDWKFIDWKKLQKTTFRLQRRIFKAVREKDIAKAKRLQKLILTSYAARMLAIRQVTQLNQGKKTAGVDGKKSLTFEERFQLEKILSEKTKDWKHQSLREIPIPKKDGSKRLLKVPTIADRAWQCLVKYALEPDSRCNIPRSKLWV